MINLASALGAACLPVGMAPFAFKGAGVDVAFAVEKIN
jgi:hypothetical protein